MQFLRRFRLRHVLWVAAPLLFLWALRGVSFKALWETLGRLAPGQLLALAAVNLGVVLLLSGRWWAILWSLGRRLPYVWVSGYRLAAFAVSYFTPGPHFGGEPLQAYLVQLRHGVRGPLSAASVVLDKTFELLANFAFLVIGVVLLVRLQLLPQVPGRALFLLAVVLLALPVGYLAAARLGVRPLTELAFRLPSPRAGSWADRLQTAIGDGEQQVVTFSRAKPGAILAAVGLSALIWLALVSEYWLMLRFLGIELSLAAVVGALTAARLALLLPFPGGLGALEASQILALSALGFSPAEGAGLALLIRARDLLFGGAGLALGVWLTGGRRVLTGGEGFTTESAALYSQGTSTTESTEHTEIS